MAKELVLFTIYSFVHLLVIVTTPRESYIYLPSKIIPILILIISLFRHVSLLSKRGKWVSVGLVFSLFGDAFLALPGGKYFVPGLGSFLIAQLLYSYAFSIRSEWKPILFLPFLLSSAPPSFISLLLSFGPLLDSSFGLRFGYLPYGMACRFQKFQHETFVLGLLGVSDFYSFGFNHSLFYVFKSRDGSGDCLSFHHDYILSSSSSHLFGN